MISDDSSFDFDPLQIEYLCNCAIKNQLRMRGDQAAQYCLAKLRQRRQSPPAVVPVPVPSRVPRRAAPNFDICSGMNKIAVRQSGLDWCDERIYINTPRPRLEWEMFAP